MSRQIRIVHTTGYTYPGGATASFNEARMTPRSTREQLVLTSSITVSPLPWMSRYVDYWGTQVDSFEVHERHDRLNVVATSTVEVERRPLEIEGLTWEQLLAPEQEEAHTEWLHCTERVQPGEELRAITRAAADSTERPRDCVRRVLDAIAGHIQYLPGSTDVHARADDSWSADAGVCQDLVHLSLGALREVGIPARYVSGYVMPSADAVVGEKTTGESHAWLQYWDGAWVGIDPTLGGVEPGEFHVEVGIGRDYGDVPPLRGIYTGSGESDMFVGVEMTLLA